MIVTSPTPLTTPTLPPAPPPLLRPNATPDPASAEERNLAFAYAARDALRSDVSWRRLKREWGKIYRWGLRNLGTVVREALLYPSGLVEGHYEMPKYYGAADGHPLEGLSISKQTGMFWLPLEGVDERTRRKHFLNGDLFYFIQLAREFKTREEAPEWLWALKERMESKEWRLAENRRRFVERNKNWNEKDVLWEIVGGKEWYGTTTALARLLNDKLGADETDGIDAGSVRRKIEGWLAPTDDVHRFVVTRREWRDARGHVNKRRYTLVPTGRDVRRETALARANRSMEVESSRNALFCSLDRRDELADYHEREWRDKPEMYYP
jgi:hypothetical protein